MMINSAKIVLFFCLTTVTTFADAQNKPGIGIVPWKTVGGSWWYGAFSIGNPPQQFQFKMSLMARDLFVYNKNVTVQSEGTHLENRTRQLFDSDISTTFVPDGQPWCQGDASDQTRCERIFPRTGVIGQDSIKFGQMELPSMRMGLVDFAEADFEPGVIDGVFGLQIGQSASGLPSPLEQAMPKLAKPIYTIYSDKHASPDSFRGTGEITFGAEDERHCNSVDYQYIPVERLLNGYIPGTRLQSISYGENTWQIQKNLYFGLTARSFEGDVEVSTNFISGNAYSMDQIAAEFGATREDSKYILPCNSTFTENLVLKFGQNETVDFVIKPEEYLLTRYDGRCTLILEARECDECVWVSGADFIYSRCNARIFGGKQQIGLAPVVRS